MEAVEAVEASQSKGSIHSPIIYYLGKSAVIKPVSKTLNWSMVCARDLKAQLRVTYAHTQTEDTTWHLPPTPTWKKKKIKQNLKRTNV